MTKKNHKRNVRRLKLERKRSKMYTSFKDERGMWRYHGQKEPRKHGEGNRGRGLGGKR